jgi:hypothetical protein
LEPHRRISQQNGNQLRHGTDIDDVESCRCQNSPRFLKDAELAELLNKQPALETTKEQNMRQQEITMN